MVTTRLTKVQKLHFVDPWRRGRKETWGRRGRNLCCRADCQDELSVGNGRAGKGAGVWMFL